MNRRHLAISLRCTMYDALWQLRTDAMATLACSGEVCLHVHVLLSDVLSLRSDSVFALPCAQKRQISMLVAISAICVSVACEWSSESRTQLNNLVRI